MTCYVIPLCANVMVRIGGSDGRGDGLGWSRVAKGDGEKAGRKGRRVRPVTSQSAECVGQKKSQAICSDMREAGCGCVGLEGIFKTLDFGLRAVRRPPCPRLPCAASRFGKCDYLSDFCGLGGFDWDSGRGWDRRCGPGWCVLWHATCCLLEMLGARRFTRPVLSAMSQVYEINEKV